VRFSKILILSSETVNEKIFSKSESATNRIAFITDDGTFKTDCEAHSSQ
jgi:hypothetical protein